MLICPDCGATLAGLTLTTFRCDACRRGFWLLGGQLRRDDGSVAATPRARRPTPQKPSRAVSPERPVRPRRDPATVRGAPTSLDCPDCRSELLAPAPGVLHCPGCGAGYWMRGGQVIREGELDPIALPERTLPKATVTKINQPAPTARIRPRTNGGQGDDDS